MTVSVIAPWRATPTRQPVWDMLRPRWEALGCQIVEGTCPPGPWRKALAVADALPLATGDVLVIADADVWCNGTAAAVTAVEAGAPWAVPHCRILRLAEDGRSLEVPPHPAVPGGGITVIRRDAYRACPMPAMYRREDEAWGTALTEQFGRPWRGFADLTHYWHEREAGDVT